ncbi:MAG: hypothetical protein Q9160_008642 [Pyrenula sp. 1 TL-2023]
MSGQYGQYGSYSQPPYQYGPLRPEWQSTRPLPRSSWNDPRLNEPHQNAGPAPSSGNYNPNTYGPVSGVPASVHPAHPVHPVQQVQPVYPQVPQPQNTSTWGVRYNQGHQDGNAAAPRPPLPPRPASTTQQVQSPANYAPPAQHQWHGQSSQPAWNQSYDHSNQSRFSNWPQNTQQAQQSSQSGTPPPPPPPPRPPAYQNLSQNVQGWIDHQYSEQPPSHRYDPAPDHFANPNTAGVGNAFPTQNTEFQNLSHANAAANTAPQFHQAEQPAVSPISPEKEDGRQYSWEQFERHPTISTMAQGQRTSSIGYTVAPPVENTSHLTTSHEDDVARISYGSTDKTDPKHVPKRDDSVSPELQKTDTIDDLISSWQQPLVRAQQGNLDPRSSRRSSVSALDEEPSPAVTIGRSLSTVKPDTAQHHTASLDPIVADIQELKPESRASLERYLTALRREAAASADEDKYRVFKAFLNKELRLKAILYGVDEDELVAPPPKSTAASAQPLKEQAPNSPTLIFRSTDSKPLSSGQPNNGDGSPRRDEANPLTLESTHDPRSTIQSPLAPTDESYVLVDGSAEGEYSPGGRPRILKIQPQIKIKPQIKPPSIEIPTQQHVPPQRIGSPSDYAPMVVEAPDEKGADSPGVNAPIVLEHADLPQANIRVVSDLNDVGFPIMQSPAQPVYTPFKYGEGPSNTSYAQLRQASAESGRVMSQTNTSSPIRFGIGKPRSPSVALQQEETFLGLIREKSVRRSADQGKVPDVKSIDNSNLLATMSKYLKKVNLQAFATDVPIDLIQQDLEQYPDDFVFIRQAVLAWDRSNKERMSKLEASRRRREEESEAHIDELFNAKQIGYPDIKTLESDFIQSEVLKKQEEYREELKSFVTEVYNEVTSRINLEIQGLGTLYTRSLELLEKDAVSGSRLILSSEGTNTKPRVAALLKLALLIFHKLQIRYRKRVEAERERQRRSALCDASSNRASNQLEAAHTNEADYALFEKQSAVQAAEDHDERANKLMDIFDAVVVKALGENEQFINDLKANLQQADLETRDPTKFKGDLYGPNGLRPLLSSVESIISAISADSASILQSSDVADQLLNNADYDVSVTKARMEHTDESTFRQLEEDKTREDEKIRSETASRASGMNKGPEEASQLVRSIIARVGDNPEHEERIKKALEAAKKRNAAREV